MNLGPAAARQRDVPRPAAFIYINIFFPVCEGWQSGGTVSFAEWGRQGEGGPSPVAFQGR